MSGSGTQLFQFERAAFTLLMRYARVSQARAPSLLPPRWSQSQSTLGRWWQPRVRSPAYWEYVILTERYVYRE